MTVDATVADPGRSGLPLWSERAPAGVVSTTPSGADFGAADGARAGVVSTTPSGADFGAADGARAGVVSTTPSGADFGAADGARRGRGGQASRSPRRRATANETTARAWRLRLPGGRSLELGGPVRVMGIVNVTPDSFSDGGLHLDPDRATDRALRLLAEGADLVDLGAESTRPGGGSVYGAGAETVDPDEELRRLLPVLRLLRPQTDAPISIDTRKAAVARAALDCGADLINDVSALDDPDMGPLLAERDAPVVLMHSRGDLATMQRDVHFDDVVAEVADELDGSLEAAIAAGIPAEQTLLDPGIGFGKTVAHNVMLLARLDALVRLGRPLLVGASRKSFIGQLSGGDPPGERLAGSLAAAAWACRGGARIVRVHDVAQTVKFLKVWAAIDAAAATTSAAPARSDGKDARRGR